MNSFTQQTKNVRIMWTDKVWVNRVSCTIKHVLLFVGTPNHHVQRVIKMLPKKRKFIPTEFENFNFSSSGQQEVSNEDDHVAAEDNNEAEMEDVGIDLSCKTRPSPDAEVITAFRKISNDTSVTTASAPGPSSSVIYNARYFVTPQSKSNEFEYRVATSLHWKKTDLCSKSYMKVKTGETLRDGLTICQTKQGAYDLRGKKGPTKVEMKSKWE